ncbi:MAG: NAD(P)/FAD-dependent oxidoreductase [Candidatus Bathyarchaeia archaeon]
MLIMKAPDVLVIGAGPCGSFTAFNIASQGFEVLLCEEHNEVGKPTHCTGHASIGGFKKIGISIPKSIIQNEVHGAIVYPPNEREFLIERRDPVSTVIDRNSFDKYLSKLAVEKGTQLLLNTKVQSLLIRKNLAKVVLMNNEKRMEVFPKLVIDAEGSSGDVLRNSGFPAPKRSACIIGINALMDKVEAFDERIVEVYLSQKYAPNFFAWIVPIRGGMAKVGLGISEGNPLKFFELFTKRHPIASKKLRGSKTLSLTMHTIPLEGGIARTYHEGLLVVGDSASQVKPTTGGGITFGLICSKIASKVACEALKANDCSQKFLANYQKSWKKSIGLELYFMKKFRNFMNSLSDKEIDKMIKKASALNLETLISKTGDMDYQGSSFLKVLWHPSMLAFLFHLIFKFFDKKGFNFSSNHRRSPSQPELL